MLGTGSVPALAIRKRLGRDEWAAPIPFGPDGWKFRRKSGLGMVILTCAPAPDDEDGTGPDWWHASISRPDVLPSYAELSALHAAVWPDGWAFQVFAPPSAHINIHPHALHLWGRADGVNALPDFGKYGTI